MKICLVGIPGVKPGKHNLKDPRLDQADKLVEASKKTYPQADVIGEENALDADAFLVTRESRADLILKDLEFVETRLSRSPLPAEQVVLDKIKTVLENDHFIVNAGLSPEELQAVAAHSFYTNKPIIVAGTQELEQPDHLLLRVFKEAGYISFLTVAGRKTGPGRPAARFTRTFKKDSFGPRSSASTISSPPAAKPRPNEPASSASRRRTM